jgi:hypothetical protein
LTVGAIEIWTHSGLEKEKGEKSRDKQIKKCGQWVVQFPPRFIVRGTVKEIMNVHSLARPHGQSLEGTIFLLPRSSFKVVYPNLKRQRSCTALLLPKPSSGRSLGKWTIL